MSKIILISENGKEFDDKKQAVTELAFCHYPVTVCAEVDGKMAEKTFDSFDSARIFVETKV